MDILLIIPIIMNVVIVIAIIGLSAFLMDRIVVRKIIDKLDKIAMEIRDLKGVNKEDGSN
ncbi:MAG: hypothetical protein ACOYJU_03120 [Anaerovoracaceae bacterium]|jgi:hypothetical protein